MSVRFCLPFICDGNVLLGGTLIVRLVVWKTVGLSGWMRVSECKWTSQNTDSKTDAVRTEDLPKRTRMCGCGANKRNNSSLTICSISHIVLPLCRYNNMCFDSLLLTKPNERYENWKRTNERKRLQWDTGWEEEKTQLVVFSLHITKTEFLSLPLFIAFGNFSSCGFHSNNFFFFF